MSEKVINELVESVLQGRRNKLDEGIEDGMKGQLAVTELVTKALEAGTLIDTIIGSLSSGMQLVGERYERGYYFIPDMLAAAEAVGAGMEILEPHLIKAGRNKGKFIMATVESDQHDIGKNLASIMLKGAGYQVIDLGVNVPAKRIVEIAEKQRAELIGLSALLNTTMPYMRSTIEMLEDKGLRGSVKVIIGGAPTSEEFASKIGADAYGKDAFAAVREADRLLKNERGLGLNEF